MYIQIKVHVLISVRHHCHLHVHIETVHISAYIKQCIHRCCQCNIVQLINTVVLHTAHTIL